MRKLLFMMLFCLTIQAESKPIYPELKTKEDAIAFLESNKFQDNEAVFRRIQTNEWNKSLFSISFISGFVIMGNERHPYKTTVVPNGFAIEICGSINYAHGGCIVGQLSSGIGESNGPSLKLESESFKASFSYLKKYQITKK